MPDFIVYRILGNDVPCRHALDQTERNLRFLLEHEAPFPRCEKRILLNRIIDPAKHDLFKRLARRAGIRCSEVSFDPEAFRAEATEEDRLRYVTNVNAARNFCLREGLKEAPIVLPLDGNCFFTLPGWQTFSDTAERFPDAAYFSIPMWRVRKKNEEVLEPAAKPKLREIYGFIGVSTLFLGQKTEPQLAFTRHGDAYFNEKVLYGRASKVELLWRLGIKGPWDRFEPEVRRRFAESAPSRFVGTDKIREAGYVCRLSSGNVAADGSIRIRAATRSAGLKVLLDLAAAIKV